MSRKGFNDWCEFLRISLYLDHFTIKSINEIFVKKNHKIGVFSVLMELELNVMIGALCTLCCIEAIWAHKDKY